MIPFALLAAQTAAAEPAAQPQTWSHPIVMGAVDVGIVVIAVSMLLCVVRLVRGPHLADRALAVDTLGIMLIGLVILLSLRVHTLMYFDSVLVLALLAFVGTVAMAQYIARPHLKRPDPAGDSEPAR